MPYIHEWLDVKFLYLKRKLSILRGNNKFSRNKRKISLLSVLVECKNRKCSFPDRMFLFRWEKTEQWLLNFRNRCFELPSRWMCLMTSTKDWIRSKARCDKNPIQISVPCKYSFVYGIIIEIFFFILRYCSKLFLQTKITSWIAENGHPKNGE